MSKYHCKCTVEVTCPVCERALSHARRLYPLEEFGETLRRLARETLRSPEVTVEHLTDTAGDDWEGEPLTEALSIGGGYALVYHGVGKRKSIGGTIPIAALFVDVMEGDIYYADVENPPDLIPHEGERTTGYTHHEAMCAVLTEQFKLCLEEVQERQGIEEYIEEQKWVEEQLEATKP